jgi:site-specific recombinase XerD
MAQPRPIDRPIQRPLPSQGRSRTVEIERVVVPSIPLVEARERFLAGLRWKTSRITGRRLTAATADKYRNWLNRFERWLIATERELDLGLLTEDDMRHMESDLLDEIDDGTLEESSASTYTRCVKTLFADTWDHLGLNGATNPALKLHAGSQQAVDFPLFDVEHVRTLLKAAVRPRTANIPDWIAHRDQTLLACFFDLGWRVGEASQALIEHVDFRSGLVAIPRENSKTKIKGRMVGLNPDTGRLLKSWMDRYRPSLPNQFLFVNDEGDRCSPGCIRKMFRRLARAAGISKEAARVSPHTCRHYFAVQWARQHPGDLAGLQRVLGHASIRTTQIYFERAEDLGAVERQQAMPSNWR